MAWVKRFGVLESERIRVRPLNNADFGLYSALYGDEQVMRYIGLTLETNALERSFTIANQLNHEETFNRAFWVAETIDSVPIGMLGATVNELTKKIEVGIILKPEFQKNNFAFEALNLLNRHLKAKYGHYLIVARLDPSNHSAVCLVEKIGFTLNRETGLYELR